MAVKNRSLRHGGGAAAGHGEEPVPWIRYTKDSQPLPLDSPVHSLQPAAIIVALRGAPLHSRGTPDPNEEEKEAD
ncbi:unnamed protein product [Caretta caretta]